MKKLFLVLLPSISIALQIFVGQPFNEYSLSEQKYINNQNIKVITGEHFTYYVKTQNGIVKSITAIAPKMLAPAEDFIKDVNQCKKELVMRVPLRMARYEYDCPNGTYIYQTFGVVGHLETSAWIK